MTFEVNPKSYTDDGWASVIHLTIGGNQNKVGDRIPGLWFHRTEGLYIATSLNEKTEYKIIDGQLPPTEEWTRIEIKQERIGSDFFFSFLIGDQEH